MPAVPVEQLRGYEDRLVDDLIASAPDHGILLIAATFPRAYIDPNRAIDDLDPQVVGDDWSDPSTPRLILSSASGWCSGPASTGKPIYERPLGPGDGDEADRELLAPLS
jgi:N-formylglutamate deformylase